MTPEDILAIPLNAPFRLFSRDASARVIQFRDLAKKWHPDKGGRPDVFAHISALNDAAKIGVEENTVTLKSKDGKTYQVHAKKLRRFELGSVVICDRHVIFMIDRRFEDLALRGLHQIGSVKFPDKKMRDQHKQFIPVVEKVFDIDTQQVIVIKKTEDVVVLRDLVDHFDGAIDPRHVAWMVSSLLNLTCFYGIIGLCHNGLSLDTVFISPKYHTAFPIGGWWYADQYGDNLDTLPPDVHAVAPRSVLRAKVADFRVDLESIRAIARRCLGTDMSKVPQAFADFVRLPAPKTALEDYTHWQKVLNDSFGPRRFLVLPITSSDIYRSH